MIEPSDAFEARASLVAELRAHAERKTPLRRLLIRAANVIELLNLLSPAISKTDPRTHKWFDPECGEDGCQALVLRRRYESAVRGRRDFRQAYRSALLALRSRQASALPVVGETAAWADVIAERKRHVEAEGWTPERDDGYTSGQLALAASCYAYEARRSPAQREQDVGHAPLSWPFADEWWKPTTPRRDLVKAGALILAEIERQDRANALTPSVQP